MATTQEVKLHELLAEFGVGMLVTRTHEGHLRGRPMAVAEVEPGGTVWFVSGRHSGKVDELETDAHAAVTLQSGSKFVSLSGVAAAVDDRARLRRLWKTEWQAWFPGGPDDPEAVLLRVDGEAGEYWDNSGTSGVKYLIAAGRALLTGRKPAVGDDPQVHGKVTL
jgi:general stress protein 26